MKPPYAVPDTIPVTSTTGHVTEIMGTTRAEAGIIIDLHDID